MNTPETTAQEPITFTRSVKDLVTAVTFYTEKLGLELTDSEDMVWAEVGAPGIFITLRAQLPLAEPDEPIGFQVVNFSEAVAMLDEQQIDYTIENDERAQLAYFNDPDGNVLYLFSIINGSME